MKKFLEAISKLKGVNHEVLESLGPFVVSCIQENINKAPGPNAALTKELKGDKNPLKDTGELRNSITYKVNNDQLNVGSPLKKAPGLHYGQTITSKNAKKLAIPATKKVAKWSDIKGVRGFLDWLKTKGWQIAFLNKSILGTPPDKKTIMGEPIKGNKNKTQVLFIRKDSVTVPEYPFMELSKNQKEDLRETATDIIQEVIS